MSEFRSYQFVYFFLAGFKKPRLALEGQGRLWRAKVGSVGPRSALEGRPRLFAQNQSADVLEVVGDFSSRSEQQGIQSCFMSFSTALHTWTQMKCIVPQKQDIPRFRQLSPIWSETIYSTEITNSITSAWILWWLRRAFYKKRMVGTKTETKSTSESSNLA